MKARLSSDRLSGMKPEEVTALLSSERAPRGSGYGTDLKLSSQLFSPSTQLEFCANTHILPADLTILFWQAVFGSPIISLHLILWERVSHWTTAQCPYRLTDWPLVSRFSIYFHPCKGWAYRLAELWGLGLQARRTMRAGLTGMQNYEGWASRCANHTWLLFGCWESSLGSSFLWEVL